MSDDYERCRACGQTKQWHRENRPQHPFDAAGSFMGADGRGPAGTDSGTRRSIPQRLPIDATIRYLLIKKGIVTPDELDQADAEVRAVLAIGASIKVEVPDETAGAAGDRDPEDRRDRAAESPT